MKTYAEQCFERDKKMVGRLCSGFAAATVVLWPVSYLLSGNGIAGEAGWWNATVAAAWLAAAATSLGAGISLGILATITPPIEGSNR